MKDWHTAEGQRVGAEDDEYSLLDCKKESDDAFKSVLDNQTEFDKQLLTLSSAFLVLSLAFIKDVVPLKQAAFLSLLYGGFIALAFCIVLVLLSYQLSIYANMRMKTYWDLRGLKDYSAKVPEGLARAVNWVNRSSGLAFLLGVGLLVAFVISNLNALAHSPKDENSMTMAQDGAPVKLPVAPNKQQSGSPVKLPPPKPAPPPNTKP